MGFRRGTIIVLSAAVAAGAVLCVLEPDDGSEPETFRLLPENADVVGLEADFGELVRLRRQAKRTGGDDWRLLGPVEQPADPGVVDAMIAALDVARPARAVAGVSREGAERYGFSPASGAVRVELSDGGTVALSFGGPAPGERRVYARTSLHPDVVLVVDTALRASVDRRPLDLRDRRLWRLDAERIVSVEVADGENGVTVERVGRRFLVTPPGVAADFERASRLFDVVSVPRAAGFPATDACSAVEGLRIRVTGEDGAAHELRMRSSSAVADGAGAGPGAGGGPACEGCPADAVEACLDGNTPVALSADLAAMARELSADLGRTSLLPAFDPLSVTSIAVTSAAERWTLRRGPEGWRSDDGALSPDAESVRRWIRPLVLLQVDPARLGEGPFTAERTIDFSSRIGSTIRLEVSAAARDGGVLVRREGEELAFRLAPAEAAFLTAVRAYLSASPGAACDPLAVEVVEVLVGTDAGAAGETTARVQLLRRGTAGRWSLDGTTLRADAAAADLLVGDLCRLPGQPLIPRAALEPTVRWTVVLSAADAREILRLEVFAAVGGEGPFAAAGYGAPERHVLPEPAVQRLRGALVAPDALEVDGLERCTIDPGDGRTVVLDRADGTWRVANGSVEGVDDLAQTVAAPRVGGVVSLEAPVDPSADWPRRFGVRCESAGGTSSFFVGGPDDRGRVLLWSEQHGALLQTQPRVHAALGYLAALAPR